MCWKGPIRITECHIILLKMQLMRSLINWWEIYSGSNICSSLDLGKFAILNIYFSGILVGSPVFLKNHMIFVRCHKLFFFLRKWLPRFLLELPSLKDYEFYSEKKQKYLLSSSTRSFILLYISLNTCGLFITVTANEECSIILSF